MHVSSAVAEQPRLGSTALRLFRRLSRSSWAPFVVTLALALAAEVLVLSAHPTVVISPDSREYLARASALAHGGVLADPRRTPGYPAFLALVLWLSGGRLGAVPVVQCALFVVAAAEVYLLSLRLTGRPWLACLITAPVALNVYMLDWAYSIRDEPVSYWLLVTLFLVTERLVRRVRLATLLAFTLLSVALILTRPLDIFAPALLGVLLIARATALGQWRTQALKLAASTLLIYGCVVGYAQLNRVENGYFGLSYISDVNRFGVVVKYQMATLPVRPALQPMRRQVVAFVARGGSSPWDFAESYHYTSDSYAALGVYANEITRRYPLQYAAHAIGAARQVWLAVPGVDARGTNPTSFALALDLARKILLTYLALPLVAVWLLWLLRKGWRDPAIFMAAALTLVAISSLLLIGAASYNEFYRLRAPIDWAYLVALMLVSVDLLGRGLQWLQRRQRLSAGR